MSDGEVREELRGQIEAVSPKALLSHHRRGALLIVAAGVDILDVAEAVARDDATQIERLIEEQQVYRPSLAELATWCVEEALRLQFVILQPYVLAQPIVDGQSS
ncbi:MAG: DUF2288 family protein [Nannocystaceae bacterium]|nr:DUF2288 family protein [Nannocystaceae bacterium]